MPRARRASAERCTMSLLDLEPILHVIRAQLPGSPPESLPPCEWAAALLAQKILREPALPAPRQRDWVQALQQALREAPPHDLHQLACISASLTAVGHPPAQVPVSFQNLREPGELQQFLDKLTWSKDPQTAGRIAASIYSLLLYTDQLPSAWEAAWFGWFQRRVDDHSGLYHHGPAKPVELFGQWTLWPYLAGHVPVLAVHEYAHQLHPYPWRLIDTLLDMMEINWHLFCRDLEGREVPVIYAFCRSMSVTPHRQEECRQSLRRFSHRWVRYLREQLPTATPPPSVHLNILCALAHLQRCLPGTFHSHRPLLPLQPLLPFFP